MPSLTTIQATDLISNSRSVINTNFSLLNLASNLPQGFGQNYQIVTSVSSGNLTVALKTLAGTDPSATDPIYVRIGNTVRSVTSALSRTYNAGTNWLNAGSSELATKEIDFFTYLGYNSTSGVVIGWSRIPYARLISDFNADASNEKGYLGLSLTSTDEVECIGRFNATLSAGAGYTWSIPAASVIVNRPIYETRWLDYVSSLTASGSMTISGSVVNINKYKVVGSSVYFFTSNTFTTGGTAAFDVIGTLPFNTGMTSTFYSCTPCYDGSDFVSVGILQNSTFIVRKTGTTWSLGAGRVFGTQGFYSI